MMRTLPRLALAAGLLVCVVEASPGAGEKEALLAPLALPSRGVADPAGKVGYFSNPSGGIDALDLLGGNVLWSTKDANRPLFATADRLFAQTPVEGKRNQLQIVILDTTRQGKRLQQSTALVFPPWVSVGVAHGRSFASTARLDKQGLLLLWDARAWYAGGARPTPEQEKAARKQASGVARIDPQSGKVEFLEGASLPPGLALVVPPEVRQVKLGERVYSFVDRPAGDPKNPLQKRRTLQAADADGKVLWYHEIAAPVYLPPRR